MFRSNNISKRVLKTVHRLWKTSMVIPLQRSASSLIAREIITGNDSCLIGDWNNGVEQSTTFASNILLLMHHHLVGIHKDHTQSAQNMLQSLTTTATENMKEYDRLLLSSCKSLICEQNFMKAAIFLETITSCIRPDPTILKLTQDLYLLAGRPDLLLKSIVRYPSCFHVSDDFRPSIFGMLGAGYAELGQFQEADEIARKSRAMSTEVDVNLIATIIDGHNLCGKSSEVKTVMDEELIKYQNLGGLSLMQCGQATSQYMRGNINFAYNELVSIFDVDFNNNKATHYPDFVYNIPVLMRSAQLLLQVLMNLTPKHMMELDRLANLMNRQLAMHSKSHRLYQMIEITLLATNYIALKTMNHSRLLKVKPVVESLPSTSLWANIFGSAKPKRHIPSSSTSVPSETETNPNSTTSSAASSLTKDSSTIANDNHTKNTTNFQREEHLKHYLGKLNDTIKLLEERLSFDEKIRPFLPILDAENGLSPIYSSASALQLSSGDAVDLYSLSIVYFAKNDYHLVAQILGVLYQHNYRELGFRAAQRDVVHQLFIESLLRSNHLQSAKLLLIERTVLVPNDGQTWRRLSIAHDLLGQKTEAEEANYTAWQLGIGQGGYGGAE